MKFNVIDGSVVNGIRELKLFTFISNKAAGFKVICEPERLHYKNINKSVLKTITIYLKDNIHEHLFFNGETLTFALQLIKI